MSASIDYTKLGYEGVGEPPESPPQDSQAADETVRMLVELADRGYTIQFTKREDLIDLHILDGEEQLRVAHPIEPRAIAVMAISRSLQLFMQIERASEQQNIPAKPDLSMAPMKLP